MTDKSDGTEGEAVVVGLSVRLLLDLYLTMRLFLSESEVIVVPPATIPGMVDVLRHHALVVVLVDLSVGNEDANVEKKDAEEGGFLFEGRGAIASWGIDLPLVKAAVTARTVAIFVMHPFGLVIADSAIMRELRGIVDVSQVEIWEVCAQCYGSSRGGIGGGGGAPSNRGAPLLGYAVSVHADASFFLFGPIKTGAAMGGGVAILRENAPDNNDPCHNRVNNESASSNDGHNDNDGSAKEVTNTMRRIQSTVFRTKTTYTTFGRW